MTTKKFAKKFLLTLLTGGSSLLMGFLSFTGMLALSPFLPFALASFALSIAYEGEIFFQNTKEAFKKLTKPFYWQQQLARQFLLAHFPKEAPFPTFFNDYATMLQQPNPSSKTLSDMEKWFAKILFEPNHSSTPYAKELDHWLHMHKPEIVNDYRHQLTALSHQFYYLKLFSLVASLFMTFGSTYLLMDAFSAIPILATLSTPALAIIILPIAVIAGAAYGLQIYNSITDMAYNKTIATWSAKIIADVRQGKIINSRQCHSITRLCHGLNPMHRRNLVDHCTKHQTLV